MQDIDPQLIKLTYNEKEKTIQDELYNERFTGNHFKKIIQSCRYGLATFNNELLGVTLETYNFAQIKSLS